MDFPHSVRLGVGSALALSLLLSLPAVAGEILPDQNNLVAESRVLLWEYIRRSRVTLQRLDELTKTRHFYPQSEWVAKSKSMQADIIETYRKAVAIQMKQRGTPPIPPVTRWYDQEVANWKNIETIGSTLIAMHGDLINYTLEIETWRLDELKKKKSEADATARQITFWMGAALEVIGKLKNFPIPNMSLVSDTFKHMKTLGSQMNPAAASLELLLVRQEASIKQFAQMVNDKKFKDNFSVLESKKIDSDQAGEYYAHERVWESNLKDHVSRFQSAYDNYKAYATPFLVHWIETELERGSSKIAERFKWTKSDKYERLDEGVAQYLEDLTDEVEVIEERVKQDERR